MGQLHRLQPPSVLFGDARGRGLRLTWHPGQRVFVLSLWEGEKCTGTIHLVPAQAARLVAVLGEQLAASLVDEDHEQSLAPEVAGI